MNQSDGRDSGEITVVRVYLTEQEGLLNDLLRFLHDEARVRGVTVFRGITGFGASGAMHGGDLLDLSLNLPLVVEFFDAVARVDALLPQLADLVPAAHVIRWPARLGV